MSQNPQLRWRYARPDDRQALQGFICTTPERRQWLRAQRRMEPHPRPWELDLQSDLRELNPRQGPGDHLLLGHDDDGLAAVARWGRSRSCPYVATVMAVAVAVRHRGTTGACAREALERGLLDLRADARAEGVTSALVTANIHPRNVCSQRLFEAYGFTWLEQHSPTLHVWSVDLAC